MVGGAEPFACGCCHLLRPALPISSHLPSPGMLSWGRQGLGVTDPLCGCSQMPAQSGCPAWWGGDPVHGSFQAGGSNQGSRVAWGEGELHGEEVPSWETAEAASPRGAAASQAARPALPYLCSSALHRRAGTSPGSNKNGFWGRLFFQR